MYISIHTLHAEGDSIFSHPNLPKYISIHTLHAEGDLTGISGLRQSAISIHTLHAEGDGKYDEKIAMVF